jgi:hypothetical protein
MVANIFRSLRPGGYFEFQEPVMPLKSTDGTLEGTSLNKSLTFRMAAAENLAALGPTARITKDG